MPQADSKSVKRLRLFVSLCLPGGKNMYDFCLEFNERCVGRIACALCQPNSVPMFEESAQYITCFCLLLLVLLVLLRPLPPNCICVSPSHVAAGDSGC